MNGTHLPSYQPPFWICHIAFIFVKQKYWEEKKKYWIIFTWLLDSVGTWGCSAKGMMPPLHAATNQYKGTHTHIFARRLSWDFPRIFFLLLLIRLSSLSKRTFAMLELKWAAGGWFEGEWGAEFTGVRVKPDQGTKA